MTYTLITHKKYNRGFIRKEGDCGIRTACWMEGTGFSIGRGDGNRSVSGRDVGEGHKSAGVDDVGKGNPKTGADKGTIMAGINLCGSTHGGTEIWIVERDDENPFFGVLLEF